MYDAIKEKNILITEGRNLAHDNPSQLTAEKWLEKYEALDEDTLVGNQRAILAGYHSIIEKKLAAKSAAV